MPTAHNEAKIGDIAKIRYKGKNYRRDIDTL